MSSENALKEFKTAHAEGIAATKAEFVKFLREGDLPQEELERIALHIYITNRAAVKYNPERGPIPAGDFFAQVVEDGVYSSIEFLENPKKYAALTDCPMCDGDGYVPKATKAHAPKLKTKKSRRVRGI